MTQRITDRVSVVEFREVASEYCALLERRSKVSAVGLFQEVYSEEREPVFSKRVQTVLDMEDSISPVPRNLRVMSRPGLDELFARYNYGDLETRNRVIQDAFKLYAYTQSDIAAFLDLSRSAISKIVCKTK